MCVGLYLELELDLLCGHPNRPHCGFCLHLSISYRLLAQKPKGRKSEIGANVLHGRSNQCTSFQLKRSKVRWTAAHNMLALGRHSFLVLVRWCSLY